MSISIASKPQISTKKNLHLCLHRTQGNSLEDFAENGVSAMLYELQLDSPNLEDMTGALEQVLSMPLVNIGAYGVDLQDYLDEYYINGLTTPEQCAEKLQDRVNIWLHE